MCPLFGQGNNDRERFKVKLYPDTTKEGLLQLLADVRAAAEGGAQADEATLGAERTLSGLLAAAVGGAEIRYADIERLREFVWSAREQELQASISSRRMERTAEACEMNGLD